MTTQMISVGVSNAEVAKRRQARRKNARTLSRQSQKNKASSLMGMKSWTPGGRYTLLREGEELQCEPHEALERNELQERHLFHFQSNDPNAQRCAVVEALSKYVSVFRVRGAGPDRYLMPTHEHLERVVPECDPEFEDEVDPVTGIPRVPDKRLKRLRDSRSKRRKLSGPKKTSRKKRRSKKMLGLTEADLRAVIPIDNFVSCPVSKSTVTTQEKNGKWNTATPDIGVLPSHQKMTALMKKLPEALELLGECKPRSREEVLELVRLEKERQEAAESEAAAENGNKKRRKPRKRKTTGGNNAADADARLHEVPGGGGATTATAAAAAAVGRAPRSYDNHLAYLSDDDEYEEERVYGVGNTPHIPSDDEAWEAMAYESPDVSSSEDGFESRKRRRDPLAQDDEGDSDFGDISLNRQYTGEPRPRAEQASKVRKAAANFSREIQQRRAGGGGTVPVNRVAQAPQPAVQSAADRFVDRALADPTVDGIPPDWVAIITNNPPTVAKQMLKLSSHYAMLESFAKM